MAREGKLDNELDYHYTNDKCINMMKFHDDDHIIFLSKCDTLPYGGHISVRKPIDEKKITIILQIKTLQKQCHFSKSFWTLLDGTCQ